MTRAKDGLMRSVYALRVGKRTAEAQPVREEPADDEYVGKPSSSWRVMDTGLGRSWSGEKTLKMVANEMNET